MKKSEFPAEFPFAHRVPGKGMAANLQWRGRMLRRVQREPEFAEVLRDACAVDAVFFLKWFRLDI